MRNGKKKNITKNAKGDSADHKGRPWYLGLDIGVASAAVAACWESSEEERELAFLDSIIFSMPVEAKGGALLNQERRSARIRRRQTRRRRNRKWKLLYIAQFLGLKEEELKEIKGEKLLDLRLKAVQERIELGELIRVLLCMQQNRGARHYKIQEDDALGNRSMAAILEERREQAKKERKPWKIVARISEEKNVPHKNFYSRERYEEELRNILQEQCRHHPELKKPYTKMPSKAFRTAKIDSTFRVVEALERSMNWQRPIRWDLATIGRCELKGEDYFHAHKAQPLFQEYRIEGFIQNLHWSMKDGKLLSKKKSPEEETRLSPKEKDCIRKLLRSQAQVSFEDMYKALGKDPQRHKFTHHKGNRTSAKGNQSLAAIQKLALEKEWQALGQAHQSFVISFLSELQDKDLIYDEDFLNEVRKSLSKDGSFKKLGFELQVEKINPFLASLAKHKSYGSLKAMGFDEKRTSYSLWALQEITQRMRKHNIREDKAIEAVRDPKAVKKGAPLRNAVVLKSLRETLRLVQYANKKMEALGGALAPKGVSFEMMRELGLSAEQKKELEKIQKLNESKNKEAVKKLEEASLPCSRHNIKRCKLWLEQKHLCAYSGKTIAVSKLDQTEIDHIIPQALGGGSGWSNLALCFAPLNEGKGDKTPYQAFSKTKNWNAIQRLAQELKESGQSLSNQDPRKRKDGYVHPLILKSQRLLTEEDPRENISIRDLRDLETIESSTAYLARLVKQKLYRMYKKRNAAFETHQILPLRGRLTAFARKEWRIDQILPQLRLTEKKALYNKEEKEIKNYDKLKDSEKTDIKNTFNKRCDHRHHIIDAAVLGLTNRSMLQKASTFYKRHAKLFAKDRKGELLLKTYSSTFIENFKQTLRDYLKNYVVWHKPDPYSSGAILKETVYSTLKGEDDKEYLVERKSLEQLAKGEKDYPTLISKIEERAEGQILAASLIEQLKKKEKLGLDLKDAVQELYFPPGSKNKVKKLKMKYYEKGPILFSREAHYKNEKTGGAQINDGYAYAELDSNAKLQLVPLHKDKKQDRAGGMYRDESSKRFYKGDMVYYKAKNDFYIVKSFSRLFGLRLNLVTEVNVKLMSIKGKKIASEIVLIPDRQTLTKYVQIRKEMRAQA